METPRTGGIMPSHHLNSYQDPVFLYPAEFSKILDCKEQYFSFMQKS